MPPFIGAILLSDDLAAQRWGPTGPLQVLKQPHRTASQRTQHMNSRKLLRALALAAPLIAAACGGRETEKLNGPEITPSIIHPR